eukprot:1225372-Rhodomonas_salina.2
MRCWGKRSKSCILSKSSDTLSAFRTKTMLLQLANRSVRSLLHTLSPTTPRSAGHRCPNKAGCSDISGQPATACAGTPLWSALIP